MGRLAGWRRPHDHPGPQAPLFLLVPKAPLGARFSKFLLRRHVIYVGFAICRRSKQELRAAAFPSGAWERGKLLPCSPTAVDDQVLSGQIAAGIDGQKYDGAFQFIWPAHPAHGTLRTQPIDQLAWNPVRGERPRTETIDAHLVARPIHSQVPRHGYD